MSYMRKKHAIIQWKSCYPVKHAYRFTHKTVQISCQSCHITLKMKIKGLSWSWSYGSWIATTCAISAYHHYVVSLILAHGKVYSIQHYVIKFISNRSVVFSRYSDVYPQDSTNLVPVMPHYSVHKVIKWRTAIRSLFLIVLFLSEQDFHCIIACFFLI
jgi:hypothetical protein